MEAVTLPGSRPKNLRTAFWTQERICADLSLLCDRLEGSPKLRESSKSICRKAYELGLSKGRCVHSLIAASLFIALRKNSEPLTLRDYLRRIGADRHQSREITTYYRTIYEKLDPSVPVTDPAAFIEGLAGRLCISPKTCQVSVDILQSVKQAETGECEIAGKNPLAVACAAIYLASLDTAVQITQKDLSIAAELTEGSIRNCVGALRKYDVNNRQNQ
jgi:transcription initiation factor TFIIB